MSSLGRSVFKGLTDLWPFADVPPPLSWLSAGLLTIKSKSPKN